MFEIGRLCVKLAGRDSGKKAVIIDVLDKNYVLIDGETRRRKSNINHIEPLNKLFKIKKNASHKTVKELFKKELDIKIKDKKPKVKKEKPVKKKKQKKQKSEKIKSKKEKQKETKEEKKEKADS